MESTPIRPTEYCGVYSDKAHFYTLNAVPGASVYGEILVSYENKEYRRWNPKRSKLCAALHKKLKHFDFSPDKDVLYLGAASGTTVSHISDIVYNGRVFALEISKVPFVQLVELARVRKNIFPMLQDAGRISAYAPFVDNADVIYQDIAQKNQVEIFVNALRKFLNKTGTGYLIIKASSIDSVRPMKDVVEDCKHSIEKEGLQILETHILAPYDEEHACIVVRC